MKLNKLDYPTMQVTFNGCTVDILPPKKSVLGLISKGSTDLKNLGIKLLNDNIQNHIFADELTEKDVEIFFNSFECFIQNIKAMPQLKIPYYPEEDEDFKYDLATLEEKLVAEYSGLNFYEIEELNIVDFRLLLRDSVIYNRSQSESGRDYLEKCWILEQTEPSKNKLREMFGKEK